MRVVIDRDADRYRWRLVRRTPSGADVLARGVCDYPDEASCRQAVAALAEAAGDAALVVQQPDGHWRWQVAGEDGAPFAESPAVYPDAAWCGRALAEVCRAVGALPVLAVANADREPRR